MLHAQIVTVNTVNLWFQQICASTCLVNDMMAVFINLKREIHKADTRCHSDINIQYICSSLVPTCKKGEMVGSDKE